MLVRELRPHPLPPLEADRSHVGILGGDDGGLRPDFDDMNEPKTSGVGPQLHALPHAAVRPEIDLRPIAVQHLGHPAMERLLQEQGIPSRRYAREAGDFLVPIAPPEIEPAMRPVPGLTALVDLIAKLPPFGLGDEDTASPPIGPG